MANNEKKGLRAKFCCVLAAFHNGGHSCTNALKQNSVKTLTSHCAPFCFVLKMQLCRKFSQTLKFVFTKFHHDCSSCATVIKNFEWVVGKNTPVCKL